MNNFFKKIPLLIFAIVLFSLTGARDAYAQPDPYSPLIYVETAATNISSGATAGATVSGTVIAGTSLAWTTSVEHALSAAAFTVAQKALEQMTNNTVKWIKGGFQGNPKFAVDTDRLREDTLDVITTDIANQLQDSPICDFDPSFKVNLLVNVDSRDKTLKQKVACPFAKMLLNDPKATEKFYEDFKNGGWIGFQSTLQDAGNPFGVALTVSSELSKRKSAAVAKQDQKLGWASGFTDVVDTSNCTYPNSVQAYLSQPEKDDFGQPNPDYVPPDARKIYQQTYCPVTTPGGAIAGQLNKALGMDSDRLNLANDMDKIFSALIGQLTKQATEGIFNAITPQQKYRPAYTMQNTTNIVSSLAEVQQVASDARQVSEAEKRLSSANDRVAEVQKSIEILRAQMAKVPPCPSLTPGAECASLMNDMEGLQKDLDSAKRNLLNATQALKELRNALALSIEKADRAKAVRLTADAYNILAILARPSTQEELNAASKSLTLDVSDTMKTAVDLVRNTYDYYAKPEPLNSWIVSALDAKKASDTYRAKVDAADAAIIIAQRAQFGKEDALYAANLHMITLIKAGKLADVQKYMATIAELSAANNVAIDAVARARENAWAIRGMNADGSAPIESPTGLEKVAKWIKDAQKIVDDADALQKARTLVIDTARQSI